MKVSERESILRGIFHNILKNIIVSKRPYFDTPEREYGPISGTDIKFRDDSILNFIEKINNEEMQTYLYEYIRPDGFFFGYDNEGYENGIYKPLNHWHVGIKKNKGLFPLLGQHDLLEKFPLELIDHDGPHYKAPDMDFHYFLGIIIVNFYDDDKTECKNMLEGLGLVQEPPGKLYDTSTRLRNRYKELTAILEKLKKETENFKNEKEDIKNKLKIEEKNQKRKLKK